MTKKEASKVKIGDRLIYKEYYAFKVDSISYAMPCDIERSPVLFHDGKGGSFGHKFCRKYQI